EHQMVISTAAGTGVTALSPSGAVYFRPFVQTFGTLCATDVEVIAIQDITDATAYSPDLTALTGRVTAIESETLPDRVEVLEAAYGTPRKVFFRTYGDFVAATIASSIDTVEILGYYAANDGGGQVFGRGSNVTGAVHVGSDYWERRGDSTNFRKFGAVGDGTTGDSAAMEAADAYAVAAGVRLKATYGTYLVDDDVTLAAAVDFRGGVLKVADVKTATINGTVLAAVAPIFDAFSLGGTVEISPATTALGYPDWWGNDGGDDLPALKAAETSGLRHIKLLGRDYLTSDTWFIDTSGVEIKGSGRGWTPDKPQTRIVIISGTAHAVFIGTISSPGTTDGYVQDVYLGDMDITRSIIPAAQADVISSPAGIFHQFSYRTTVERVNCNEHCNGQVYNGIVYHTSNSCFSFRSISGSVPEHDQFIGFFANGYAASIFGIGNASIYMDHPIVSVGGAPALTMARGVVFNGGFADCFCDYLETAFMDIPIDISGLDGWADAGQKQSRNADLHIRFPINDQYKGIEIRIFDTAEAGRIHIMGGYGAPQASATNGTLIQNNNCATVITDHEDHGFASSDGFVNLRISGSKKVVCDNNTRGGGKIPIYIEDSSFCRVTDVINAVGPAAANPAVVLTGTSKGNYIAPLIDGPYTFTQGVHLLSTGCTHNEVNCTGINSACIGVAGNKLLYVATPVTTPGTFGTNNVASGVVSA
ncbi:MAG: hypothetical protein ABII76_05445, partial [Pseudomonadota bacterium]